MKYKPDFKTMSAGQIINYIWDYYKIPIICLLFAIISFISFIYKTITSKEAILDVILVNSTSSYEGSMGLEDFILQEGLDPDKYEVHANSSFRLSFKEETYADDYYVVQTLIARLTNGDIDIFGSNPEVFAEYAKEGYFVDLRDVFSEEELSAHESILVYTKANDSDTVYPCGFDLGYSAWNERYFFFNGECQFGILYNADDCETAKAFLDFAVNYN